MRKVFQKNDQGEIQVLGRTEEHPHFYEGTLIRIDTQDYRIAEIREGDLGKPLYVEPITLNEFVCRHISSKLCCPYCDIELSEGVLGVTHDTVVDCDNCSGVTHVQRLLDCKVSVDETFEQDIDIIYVIQPKVAGKLIPIAVIQ